MRTPRSSPRSSHRHLAHTPPSTHRVALRSRPRERALARAQAAGGGTLDLRRRARARSAHAAALCPRRARATMSRPGVEESRGAAARLARLFAARGRRATTPLATAEADERDVIAAFRVPTRIVSRAQPPCARTDAVVSSAQCVCVRVPDNSTTRGRQHSYLPCSTSARGGRLSTTTPTRAPAATSHGLAHPSTTGALSATASSRRRPATPKTAQDAQRRPRERDMAVGLAHERAQRLRRARRRTPRRRRGGGAVRHRARRAPLVRIRASCRRRPARRHSAACAALAAGEARMQRTVRVGERPQGHRAVDRHTRHARLHRREIPSGSSVTLCRVRLLTSTCDFTVGGERLVVNRRCATAARRGRWHREGGARPVGRAGAVSPSPPTPPPSPPFFLRATGAPPTPLRSQNWVVAVIDAVGPRASGRSRQRRSSAGSGRASARRRRSRPSPRTSSRRRTRGAARRLPARPRTGTRSSDTRGAQSPASSAAMMASAPSLILSPPPPAPSARVRAARGVAGTPATGRSASSD